MARNENGLTPIQQLMYDILSDGQSHGYDELHKCCGPSSRSNVAKHIHLLKKIVAPKGLDIVCIHPGPSRKAAYRMVRTLNNANDGRR